MRIFAIFLAFWVWSTALFAQDKTAIEGVIEGQLNAFNARDVDTAWQYASPMIQRMFGNPGNFGMMVQQGYPMVWTNSDVRFLDPRDDAGRLIQPVLIKDANGGAYLLEYEMIETPDGWKINGVVILPAPDLAA
jgi:hypothetical protein